MGQQVVPKPSQSRRRRRSGLPILLIIGLPSMSNAADAASPTNQGEASVKFAQGVKTELTASVKATDGGVQAQAVETLKTEALSMARAKLMADQQRSKNEVHA